MNGGNQNHLGVDGGGNGGIDIGNNPQSNASMPSPNPQTPSSIPDILISSMLNIRLSKFYEVVSYYGILVNVSLENRNS